jgi:hypothetical protein
MFFKRFAETFVTPQIPVFCPDSKIFCEYASRIETKSDFRLWGCMGDQFSKEAPS